MATAGKAEKKDGPKELNFSWEGKNKQGKVVRGEIKAASEAVASAGLRRQGITVTKLKKQKSSSAKVSDKDITLFSRQLATMVKSGVPLLQSFDIVGKGTNNPGLAKLLFDIKSDVETGSNLATAFRKYPQYFDALFCNLVEAGEQAGILDTLLDRLATYKEKIQAIKSKIKGALFYPISILIVAFVITAVIMIFVVPAFKGVFASFGGELPAPTLVVIAISDYFVANWYIIFGAIYAAIYGAAQAFKRSRAVQIAADRYFLKVPVFGDLIRKSSIARWTRTLSTMFAAGVPLVDALDSVGGAAGNYVYTLATLKIQSEVATGSSLTVAMENSGVFPPMVTQMVAIGEESGQLDSMLGKTADFFEAEVDEAVETLSSLMEPIIMVFLGGLIGGLVVAMYLPIFKLGSVVG
ncbi:MAG: type II secretion system F family protein [Sterolibacteriaceae bacterium]|jgi:type IV pilus assembly protein PilC|uniref:type II secretion system F family protein n=1 Tax=Sulfuritalea sp. TaxID=2480090 RepID=UPI001A504CD5|nr:type II secretion system F family protein [Sulfuritalea sp.]MBL8478400.1 type II secretion system F family protein [Sterolibacteriaceae bacterium]MBN8476779.1 type II secretion system F family protein [Sulfuritalea sp.]